MRLSVLSLIAVAVLVLTGCGRTIPMPTPPPPPVLTGITPGSMIQGETIDAVISGSNLEQASKVTIDGAEVVILNATPNTVTVRIKAD